jgi:quercetin dioxygenase-like cupin family protein
MSLLSNPLQAGNLTGTVYTFEKAGDVLPMHTHVEGTAHITIVARGKIKIHGNGWEMEKSAGAVIDFPPNQSHEFIALEDNSRIVNIVK